MNSNKSSLKNLDMLIKEVIKFREKRNWKQFHNLNNLLLGLGIECSELQELFLWKTEDQINTEIKSNKFRKQIENEIADVFVFLIYISEHFNINIIQATNKKISLNSKKYPIRKSKNSNLKYNKL
ncbi:MAG TPA: MazG-like family protein [Ignavibacteriaceae bacterium]|mgnify:CR=1 FL=1|nr:MazG-like family protein [Ignavibacteriaceae bacterium]